MHVSTFISWGKIKICIAFIVVAFNSSLRRLILMVGFHTKPFLAHPIGDKDARRVSMAGIDGIGGAEHKFRLKNEFKCDFSPASS